MESDKDRWVTAQHEAEPGSDEWLTRVRIVWSYKRYCRGFLDQERDAEAAEWLTMMLRDGPRSHFEMKQLWACHPLSANYNWLVLMDLAQRLGFRNGTGQWSLPAGHPYGA